MWSDYRGLFPDELTDARQPSVSEMKQWLEQDPYLVAVAGNKIVGVVGMAFKHDTCLLMHMVVDREYRRLGIGSALVEQVIENAKIRNATKIWLDTVPILKEAIALYVRHGFKKCGFLRKHYWGADIELYELMLQ